MSLCNIYHSNRNFYLTIHKTHMPRILKKSKKTKKRKNSKKHKSKKTQKGGNIDTIEEYERQLDIKIKEELQLLFPMGGEIKENKNYMKEFIESLKNEERKKYKERVKHYLTDINENLNKIKKEEANNIYIKMYEYYNKLLFISFIPDYYYQLKILPKNILDKYTKYNKENDDLMRYLSEYNTGLILLITKYDNNKLEFSKKYINEAVKPRKSKYVETDYIFKTYLIWVEDGHSEYFEKIEQITPDINEKLIKLKDSKTLKFGYDNFKAYKPDWPICKIISLVFDKNDNIVAYRYANIRKDGKKYISSDSYIMIDSKFRGKSLCTPFASYAYGELMKYVHQIILTLSSEKHVIACRCYIKAALSLENVSVNIKKTNGSLLEINNIDDCNIKIQNNDKIIIQKN